MSIKIYNGYEVTLATLPAFYERALLPFQKQVHALAEAKFNHLLMHLATTRIDRIAAHFWDEEPPTSSPVMEAWNTITAAYRKTRAPMLRRDHLFDFDAEVWIYVEPRRRTLLARLSSEQKEYREAWEALPGVKPFPYWSNADEPEGVSMKDWKARETRWLAATEDRHALVFSCIGDSLPFLPLLEGVKPLLPLAPTMEARRQYIAEMTAQRRGLLDGKQFDEMVEIAKSLLPEIDELPELTVELLNGQTPIVRPEVSPCATETTSSTS